MVPRTPQWKRHGILVPLRPRCDSLDPRVLGCDRVRQSWYLHAWWQSCSSTARPAGTQQHLTCVLVQVRTYAGNKGCGHTFYVIGPDGSPPERDHLTTVCSQVLLCRPWNNASRPGLV